MADVPSAELCYVELQGIHGQALRQSLSGLPDGGLSLDAAALPLPVRQAAFVEAADCFVALTAKPEVSWTRHCRSGNLQHCA